MKLTVATSQFPVDADIQRNTTHILNQMKTAKERRADVIHFPEAALSGYAGSDFDSYEEFNWECLKASSKKIMERAKELQLWVILGSTHPLNEGHKPHNSLYIIDDQGKLADRYDKMFCAGDISEETGDLAHYSPGNHFCVFEIKGVRCGTLICHDYRYPELYREYKQKGVQVMFHSYHAGHISTKRLTAMQSIMSPYQRTINPGATYPELTMPATMISYAANTAVWISCSNTSATESCWPAFFVRPDGVINGKLDRNIPGVLITVLDTEMDLYDSTIAWRERSINGIYHSGTLVEDIRSVDRKNL